VDASTASAHDAAVENLVRMMLRQQLFANGFHQQEEEGPRAATPEQISALQKRVAEDGEDRCAVCFSDYEKGDELAVLPCRHAYHTQCVGEWLKRQNSCPCCRQAI